MNERGPAHPSALSRFFGPEMRVWHGDMPLWVVFWGYGVAFSSAIVALFATAYRQGHTTQVQVLVILSAAYTIWIVTGIWRCSRNAAPFWGDLARWLTVAWALNSAFVLVFLQLDLLVQYAQG